MILPDKPILLIVAKTSAVRDIQDNTELKVELEPSYHSNEADALTCVINQMREDNPPKDWIILEGVERGSQRDPINVVKIVRRKSNV